MHLKWILLMVFVVMIATEINGLWRRGSRGRSSFVSFRRGPVFRSRRLPFFSSRRRSFVGTQRRTFVGTRRRTFVGARKRTFVSTRRRTLSGTQRRVFWGPRRRQVATVGTRTFQHSIKTKSNLNKLYNTKVVSVQKVTRPLQGRLGKFGVKHSGVVVTTDKGKKWLIHKGQGFGRSSQTVVVNPKAMSNKWSYGKTHSVTGATIGKYVKAGGKTYHLLTDNCHDATARMCKIKG